jgi:hypothetical protein
MEENQRSTRTPLDVVKANAVNVDEVASRRIVALSLFRELPIYESSREQDTADGNRCCQNGIRFDRRERFPSERA